MADWNDKTIVETQLTTDGVEDNGYGGRGFGGVDQQQQQQLQEQENTGDQQGQQDPNRRSGPNGEGR